jgi:kynureninase
MKRLTRADCARLDAGDPVASLRSRFEPPANGWLYFDANSVGAMPVTAPARMERALRHGWSELRRRGYQQDGWIESPARLGDKLAPVIGAGANSTVVCDSTSVNIFKLIVGAARLRPDRNVVISDAGNFPTDLYAAESALDLLGGKRLRLLESVDNLESALDADTAVVFLSHVDFRTGRRHDMAAINRLTRAAGAVSCWDLSHSAGAVKVDLEASGTDLAVGCGYKYLCGGPGAPAFLYVSESYRQQMPSTIAGWQGHGDRMAFSTSYAPAAGVRRHLVGTPSVLGMVALECALDVWQEADLGPLFEKGDRIRSLLIDLIDQECDPAAARIVSPRESESRGGHVAIAVADAPGTSKRLEESRVVCTSRKPDIVRFGISPLYARYTDMWDLVERLNKALIG